MTKQQLATLLAQRLQISTRRAYLLVETFFEALQDLLLRGEDVTFQNFGTFLVRELSAREIYHPGQKKRTSLRPRRRVYFRASPRLLAKLNRRDQQVR
ncbi:MAG: HU family DNA-binding protein [Thermodesulfobacteria bacterium]|nr:HU family DNA-binding protein [Thermodesulfobacteriota bacterium]